MLQSYSNNPTSKPYLGPHDDEHIKRTMIRIRDWIQGPGNKLLNSQNAKPMSYEESKRIRKDHENFEFKCMKALEGYADLSELRKNDPPDEELNKLDLIIQIFIEKLNKRKVFVIACSSFFKADEELHKNLKEFDEFSSSLHLKSLDDVNESLNTLESFREKIETNSESIQTDYEKISKLTHNFDYLNSLKDILSDTLNASSDSYQILKLRKLVLLKDEKLMQCLYGVEESLEWLQNLEEEVSQMYKDSCIGKSSIESSELHQKYTDLDEKYQKAYDYCLSSLGTYDKMCETDQRQKPKKLLSLRENLVSIGKRIERLTQSYLNQTEEASLFYKEVDSVLNETEEGLLELEKGFPPNERSKEHLKGLVGRFNVLQDKAIALIGQINNSIESKEEELNERGVESQKLIRLKLYTLWTKLREFEQRYTGNQSEINLDNNLKPDWSKDIKHSITPYNRLEKVSQYTSNGPRLPPRKNETHTTDLDLDPDDMRRKEKDIRDVYNNFTKKLSSLQISAIHQFSLPTDLSGLKSLTQEIELNINTAETHWNSFQQDFHEIQSSTKKHIPNSELIQKEALASYNRWIDNECDFRDRVILPKLNIAIRLEDLGEDLSECQMRLDQLKEETMSKVDTAQRAEDVDEQDVRTLSRFQAEAQGMRDTISAQEDFIGQLFDEAKGQSKTDFNADLKRINDKWEFYKKDLAKYEAVVKSLLKAYRTLLRSNKYLNSPPVNISELKEGELKKLIELGNNITDQITDSLASPLTIDKDAKRSENLKKCLVTNQNEVKSAVEEYKMLERKPDPLSKSQLDLKRAHESKGSRAVPQLNAALDDGPGRGRHFELLQDIKDVQIQANGPVVFKCQYTENPNIDARWFYQKAPNEKMIEINPNDENISIQTNSKRTTLSIHEAQPIDQGLYTVIMTDRAANKMYESSGVLTYMEPPKIVESLKNIKNAKIGAPLSFKLTYVGFKEIPQSILWFHENKLINSNEWNIVVGKTGTEIFKEKAVLNDQGEYNCRIQDTCVLGTSALESFAYLLFSEDDLKQTLESKSCKSILINDQEETGDSPEAAPLTLRCPLPDEITKMSTVEPKIQWLHNNKVIYDSSRNFSSLNERFVIGKTMWHARLSGNQAILSSDAVYKIDSGKYCCRIQVGDDVYESTGKLGVLEIPQIIKKLPKTQTKMVGDMIELECQLKHTPGMNDLKTEWFHNGKLIDGQYQKKNCISLVENPKDHYILRIESAQDLNEGSYKFVATLPGGSSETTCQLIIEETVRPKIFGEIDAPEAVKRNDTVHLSVDYVAFPKPQVHWLKDGKQIIKDDKYESIIWGKRAILKIKDFQGCDSGNYTVIIENQSGSEKKTISYIPKFDNLPITPKSELNNSDNNSKMYNTTQPNYSPFLLEPDNIRVRKGDLVRFCCLLKPELINDNVKVNWIMDDNVLRNGDVLEGGGKVRIFPDTPIKGAHQLEINPVSVENAGCYQTEVVCDNGKSVSRCNNWLEVEQTPRRVQDRSPPSIETPLMSNYSIKEGEPFQMNVKISGRPAPEVVWIKDGQRLEDTGLLNESVQVRGDSNNHSLIIPTFQNRHAGRWTMIANNPSGLITSSTEINISPVESGETLYDSTKPSFGNIDLNQTTTYGYNDSLPIKTTTKTTIRSHGGIPVEPGDRIIYPRSRSASTHRVLDEPKNSNYANPSEYSRLPQTSNEYSRPDQRTQLNLSNTVLQAPPKFVNLFSDVCVASGDTVRLSCQIEGNPPPEVWWTYNGDTLSPMHPGMNRQITNQGSHHSLILNNIKHQDSGRYSITAENSSGVATCSALVIVDEMKNQGNLDRYAGSTSPLRVTVPSSASPTIPATSHDTNLYSRGRSQTNNYRNPSPYTPSNYSQNNGHYPSNNYNSRNEDKMTYEDNYRRYQPKRDIQPSSYKYTPSPVRNLSQPSVHVGVHVKLRTSQSPSNVQRVPISIESRDRMTQNSPFNKDRHMHRSCEFLSEPNFDYEPHPFQRQSNLHQSRDHSPIFHSTTPFRYKSPNLQSSHVEVKHSFMPPSHSSNEPCCSSKINQRFTTHHNESTYNESSVYTTSSFEERYRTNVYPETTTIPNKRQNNNCVKVIKINKTISDTNEKIEKKKKNVTQTSPYQPNEDAKEVFHFTVESSDIDD